MESCAVICAVLLCAVWCTEACNLYAFERCVTEFTDKYPETSDSFAPSYSEEQLQSVCIEFDIASTCVRPAIGGCGQDVQIMWAVLHSVMDYMCSQHTKLILGNFSSCVEGDPLQTQVEICNKTMQRTTKKIERHGGTQDELCDAMMSFGRCTVNSADELCGPQVASWYGGLVDAALDPTKHLIDCYFTAGASAVSMNSFVLLAVLPMAYLSRLWDVVNS